MHRRHYLTPVTDPRCGGSLSTEQVEENWTQPESRSLVEVPKFVIPTSFVVSILRLNFSLNPTEHTLSMENGVVFHLKDHFVGTLSDLSQKLRDRV